MLSVELFVTKIKPHCEQFLKSPTLANIRTLQESLSELEDVQIDSFQTYVLLPFVVKLEELNERDSEIKTLLIVCIRDVIGKIRIKELKAFKTILVIVLKQIHDFEKGHMLLNLSEERKLAAVECLLNLFNRSTHEVLEQLYTTENSFLLAKIGVTCVELISTENYRALRIASIKCLMALFFVYDDNDLNDPVMRHQVASTTFIFLPKIVQTLIDIARGDNTLGESLISISIQALGRILCLIFEDYEKLNDPISYSSQDILQLFKLSKENDENKILLEDTKKYEKLDERIKNLQEQGRTSDWLTASSKKLIHVLKIISNLRAHESTKVRTEYGILCSELSHKCFKHLKENFITFLEGLIALSEDEDAQIRKNSQNYINIIRLDPGSESIFKETVSILFEIHMKTLPRIINRCDGVEQKAEFLLLKGFFSILPEEDLRTIFSFQENVNCFCSRMISALDLEVCRDLLVEEYALRTINDEMWTTNTFPWRRFKNLQNVKIVLLIQEICDILGRSSAVDAIFDELISLLPGNAHICNEIILFIVFLLCISDEQSLRLNAIKSVLEEILQEERWHLALRPDTLKRMHKNEQTRWFVDSTPGLYESAIEIRVKDVYLDEDDDETDDHVTINDASFNVLHSCILLDAIGNLSKTLGKMFEPFVFRSLNKVLLKAGNSNCVVYSSASFALHCIKDALGFEKISDLIQHFSDYISFHINYSLKKVERSHEAVDVLTVVLRFTSKSSLSYLERVIGTMLEECTRSTQAENLISYLKLFNIFLSNIKKWEMENLDNVAKITSVEFEEEHDDLADHWLSLLIRSKDDFFNNVEDDVKINENVNIEDEAKINEDFVNNSSEEPQKPELPQYIRIVIEILQKVLKYISSKDQELKIMSMECLTTGLPLLRDYENELLPIVHMIWDPLTQRFKDKDPVVLLRCFELLNILATYGRDFILSRTLKDVLPFLCQFLINSAKNSIRDRHLSQTQEVKLQKRLLNDFSNLLINIDIQERELDRVTEAVILYLDQKQPEDLQKLAVEYFKSIFKFNGPFVYSYLTAIENNAQYRANVQIMLPYINK